jgi:hypothetical protein
VTIYLPCVTIYPVQPRLSLHSQNTLFFRRNKHITKFVSIYFVFNTRPQSANGTVILNKDYNLLFIHGHVLLAGQAVVHGLSPLPPPLVLGLLHPRLHVVAVVPQYGPQDHLKMGPEFCT